MIQPGSHIDKAVKTSKWQAMQEKEERIAIGEVIMQKVIEAKHLEATCSKCIVLGR